MSQGIKNNMAEEWTLLATTDMVSAMMDAILLPNNTIARCMFVWQKD